VEAALYVKKGWGAMYGDLRIPGQRRQPYTLTSQAHFVKDIQWPCLKDEPYNVE